jgi:hypothetical protein
MSDREEGARHAGQPNADPLPCSLTLFRSACHAKPKGNQEGDLRNEEITASFPLSITETDMIISLAVGHDAP